MRLDAEKLFQAGISAADPISAVRKSLEDMPITKGAGKIYLIAVGKAAIGMTQAALDCLPDVSETLVVTNPENAVELAGATVFAAGHPVPDETGLKAGRAVAAMLDQAGAEDTIVALISGGGSALLPAPVDGVSLGDKAEVSRLLLGAGIDIHGMNLVRQQLSRLKGGGFVQLASPAKVVALVLSDVVGDDLSVIASGPTVAPIGDKPTAVHLLQEAGIWQDMPQSVRDHLGKAEPDAPPEITAENRLVGSNAKSVAAMAAIAPEAHVYDRPLEGDVAEAAKIIMSQDGPGIWLFGGETTVRLAGTGLGGRNQELALRVALLAEEMGWGDSWVFLSGGTDGRDGPTDAAGGLVDGGSLARMRAAGDDPRAFLANNDSYHALQSSGDLLMTGGTGTNVADLQVLIRR
ncbi:MAG: glycerate kinase type-2 family protein [Marinosulfonomonas sp.]